MRATLRLLAKVQPAKFLEVDAPTGLAGITTHPSPRPALIYMYGQTLKKLQAIPESSVYRQSTEAITRARLKVVQDTKPAGYEEWRARIKAEVEKNPAAYAHVTQEDGSIAFLPQPKNISEVWDGETREAFTEGPQSEAAAKSRNEAIIADDKRQEVEAIPKLSELEPEPPLDADQYVMECQVSKKCTKFYSELTISRTRLGQVLLKRSLW